MSFHGVPWDSYGIPWLSPIFPLLLSTFPHIYLLFPTHTLVFPIISCVFPMFPWHYSHRTLLFTGNNVETSQLYPCATSFRWWGRLRYCCILQVWCEEDLTWFMVKVNRNLTSEDTFPRVGYTWWCLSKFDRLPVPASGGRAFGWDDIRVWTPNWEEECQTRHDWVLFSTRRIRSLGGGLLGSIVPLHINHAFSYQWVNAKCLQIWLAFTFT